MSKFIIITGGVVSSLGKGISGASIGKLLQLHGLKVNMIKCDPCRSGFGFGPLRTLFGRGNDQSQHQHRRQHLPDRH